MLGIVVLLLVVCLGAAVVGTLATGPFSLALISLALLLGTGAVGLTLHRPRGAGEEDAGEDVAGHEVAPARQAAAVTQLGSRRRVHGGDAGRRAA